MVFLERSILLMKLFVEYTGKERVIVTIDDMMSELEVATKRSQLKRTKEYVFYSLLFAHKSTVMPSIAEETRTN